MLKRTLIVISLAVALMLGAQQQQRVHGILMTDAELLTMNRADATAANNEQTQGRENNLLHALKAPFKAIGRLFGRGRKGDNKLQRLSENDAKRFESTPVNQISDATSVAQVGPESDPRNIQGSAQAHLERGRALLNGGNLNEAIAELSRAASLDFKLSEAHNLLGVAYQLKGLPEMGRRSFQAALKVDKNNLQTLNNLGYLLSSNGDYKGALTFLKKAVRLAPDDPLVLNNLALAQSQLGKFDEATKNFVRAGGEIKGRLNIANRLEIVGRSAEARKHYEAARLQAEASQRTNPNSQAITVLMEVENGRIKYASVPNRRPGLAAYEATAMRIARERRYPANKSGQESIVIRVSSVPAS
ncbi:MAG: tetratricopeptide repeat protein [Pyrinomonadaceae bacterium]|nr:tetratricopeptide repeat protein [Pyrinomonadaceae bacterium]